MQSEAVTGVLSILVGGVVSVAVAWISRPRARKTDEEEQGESASRRDLTTIAGIAAELVQQGEDLRAATGRITELEAARVYDARVIGALRRYVLALKTAMRTAGVEPPEPVPDDAPLIAG
ncbi:hypothetical protein PUR59_01485 [Streptomyces sp. SP18ES09]|uniref:hypothetical protein n=1 Tax=Streptomyces sp. SP18ES09 TaxID=3002532 RepID=UPI002E76D32B|nr:hypothetical protein [Streptomyces sp. SP18ES09]MEE1813713.1 hypothetical protein [Streptomyces sp. SP18ES09]